MHVISFSSHTHQLHPHIQCNVQWTISSLGWYTLQGYRPRSSSCSREGYHGSWRHKFLASWDTKFRSDILLKWLRVYLAKHLYFTHFFHGGLLRSVTRVKNAAGKYPQQTSSDQCAQSKLCIAQFIHTFYNESWSHPCCTCVKSHTPYEIIYNGV